MEATEAMAMATVTARGLPRLSPAMAMVATAMADTATVATAMDTARGRLSPATGTDMATAMAVTATGTATARGLPRQSPATDTAMVVMAMAVTATATARGPPRLSPATDMAMATDMDTATTGEDAPHTTAQFNASFCDRLRIFNYVSALPRS